MKETTLSENFISIVGQNLADCNLTLLLSQINWNYKNIEIVKLIKTGLNDLQLNQLLNFLVRSKVHTLMLSYNNLTELSLDALLHFVSLNSTLKNIYLPKNNISLLKGNARPKIHLLKQKGINLYIWVSKTTFFIFYFQFTLLFMIFFHSDFIFLDIVD